jgi:hypothetical protein
LAGDVNRASSANLLEADDVHLFGAATERLLFFNSSASHLRSAQTVQELLTSAHEVAAEVEDLFASLEDNHAKMQRKHLAKADPLRQDAEEN